MIRGSARACARRTLARPWTLLLVLCLPLATASGGGKRAPAPQAPQSLFVVEDVGFVINPALGDFAFPRINENGEVVGGTRTIPGGFAAAVANADLTQVSLVPGFGGKFANGYALNEQGQVAGEAEVPPGQGAHGFLYTPPDPQPRDLGTFGGARSMAFAINAGGQAVGTAQNAHFQGRAFLASGPGPIRDLGDLGGGESVGLGINDRTQVVGQSITANGRPRAFRWANGKMADLGTLPGGGDSIAYAINNSGQITGGAVNARRRQHAFLFTNSGGMADLGALVPGDESLGLDLNNLGAVVGASGSLGFRPRSRGPLVATHAFLFTRRDDMRDLNALIDPASGWVLREATGINDAGQIVGTGLLNGEERVYRLKPTAIPPPVVNSAIVTLYRAGQESPVARIRLSRGPDGFRGRFDNLPPGRYQAVADGYATFDWSGPVIARASGFVTVMGNHTAVLQLIFEPV